MRAAVWLLALAVLGVAGYFGYRWLRPEVVVVTLVPGKSVWDHARTIEQLGFGPAATTLAHAADEQLARGLGLPVRGRAPRGDGVQETWLEGFIYPETYHIPKGSEALDVLKRAAAQFQKVWAALREEHAAEIQRLRDTLGLTEADLVVLASLVEKEMADRAEAPRIAGVFLNRLERKMRLETDPTLMYRPDRVGKKPTPNERRDRTNPYNTYAIPGLPPGPICSPGRDALEAVLTAERHDYLFFVARRDGSRGHAFSRTLEEHDQNIDRYLRKRPAP